MALKLVDSRSATWLFRGVANKWGNVDFPASRFNSEGARLRLPEGTWEVRMPDFEGQRVELRSDAGVVASAAGELRTIFAAPGDIDYWVGLDAINDGKEFLMILTRFNPPPLGLRNFTAAFVRRWRNGAKASRPRGGYCQRGSVDGSPLRKSRHPHYECAGRGNRHAGGVEARQQRAGSHHRPGQRKWACHHQREYGRGDPIHRRQLLRDGNLPHRLAPVGVAHA